MLVLLLVGIGGFIFLGFAGMLLLKINYDSFDESDTVTNLACVIIIFAIIWFVVFSIATPSYIRAETKAKIINNQYGTEYTADEVFWAGNTIDKLIRTENNLKDNNQKIELDIK